MISKLVSDDAKRRNFSRRSSFDRFEEFMIILKDPDQISNETWVSYSHSNNNEGQPVPTQRPHLYL